MLHIRRSYDVGLSKMIRSSKAANWISRRCYSNYRQSCRYEHYYQLDGSCTSQAILDTSDKGRFGRTTRIVGEREYQHRFHSLVTFHRRNLHNNLFFTTSIIADRDGDLTKRAISSTTRNSGHKLNCGTAALNDRLFKKVLVANRGEIACRVMMTCKQLGIPTVAVHSTVDSKAVHARMADERVCIGPAPSLQSYLNVDAILHAIEHTQADAVHPGYGFLSENPIFSRKLKERNITFIGPSSHAIEAMGDKITSKMIAMDAKVNVIPGYEKFITSADHAVEVANEIIGYPIMIKATAGGGGKGMRICYNDRETREGFQLSTAESRNFFNDDRLFMEKFIENPHHIEIQVLAGRNASATGKEAQTKLDVLCFPERECSIQRRNQKILEESPSVLLTTKTRKAMVEQVKRLVEKVDYESAGTIEFLVDENQNFYFLEMNTRLQVEHPVTEAVTGVDLVELMVRVAAGKGIPKQIIDAATATEDGMVPRKGWAIEARIYAEDPIRGFLPSTGPLLHYEEPPQQLANHDISGYTVRIDSGVTEGSEISVHYDPMISKLITHADSRNEAIDGMIQALDRYVIRGVKHNVSFLNALCRHKAFRRGDTPTNFINKNYTQGFTGVLLSREEKGRLASFLVHLAKMRREILGQPPLPLQNERTNKSAITSAPEASIVVSLGGMFGKDGKFEVTLDSDTGQSVVRPFVVANAQNEDEKQNLDANEILKFNVKAIDYDPVNAIAEVSVDGNYIAIQVLGESDTGILTVQMSGATVQAMIMSPEEYALTRHMKEPQILDTSNLLTSPMPGTLISIDVKEGDIVEVGQPLCIVEAMKMQNVLRSSKKGIVSKIRVMLGSSLRADDIIMDFMSEGEK